MRIPKLHTKSMQTPKAAAGMEAKHPEKAASGKDYRRPVEGRPISRPIPTDSGLDLKNPVNHQNTLKQMEFMKESWPNPNYSIADDGKSVGKNKILVGDNNFLLKQYGNPNYDKKRDEAGNLLPGKAGSEPNTQDAGQEHHRILTFSGSKENPDWLHDVNSQQVHVEGLGMMHKGIWDAYSATEPKILETLGSNKEDLRVPLMVEGHSLGGAEASIAAARLKQKGYNVIGSTTVGSPKVGDSTWASNYEKMGIPTYRYDNENDPVPHLPPSNKYVHVGTPFHLSNDRKLLPEQEPMKFMDTKLFKDPLYAHHLTSYAGNLEKTMDTNPGPVDSGT